MSACCCGTGVVGGGPTGVEYSGALGELIQLVAGNDYPSISPAEVRIVTGWLNLKLLVGEET